MFRYRGSLPLVILFTGLIVYITTLITSSHPGSFLRTDSYKFICLAVSLFGEAIRIYTVGYTPANTSGRNRFRQLADKVNTTGIYSTVRHPLYVGNFFMWLGLAMLTTNLWFILVFILFYWIYYERIMYAEEMFLYNKFKEGYKDWALKTPAFIPEFKNYAKPELPFSWRKILKKEKNGISAVFILFFFFDLTGKSIEANKIIFPFDKWFYMALVATILYFILKYLKWNTSVLDEEGR